MLPRLQAVGRVFKVLSVWSPQAKNRPRSLLFLSLPQHQPGVD